MPNNETRGARLFRSKLEQIQQTITRSAAHKRLSPDDRDELYSAVMLKLIQNDYAILRRFRGDSSWRTFLTVVIQRVQLDQRTQKWGRWRPCAAARRLGPVAVELDRRISRDGLDPEEAVQTMAAGSNKHSTETLRRTAENIRRRHGRRQMISDQVLAVLPSDEHTDRRIELAEGRARNGFLATALGGLLEGLSVEDRELLDLRFHQGWTVARIATSLDRDPRVLYRHFTRLLRCLRQEFEAQGWDRQEIRTCLDQHQVEPLPDLLGPAHQPESNFSRSLG